MGLFRRREAPTTELAIPQPVELLPTSTRAPSPRGFTAAATLIDLADPDIARREAAAQRKRPFKWQKDAWRFYDEVELARNYGRWSGDVQSRMRLFPAYLDDPDQPPTPALQSSAPAREIKIAMEAFDRIRSDEEDIAELQRVFGVNLAMTGEVWLVGTDEQPAYATKSNPTGERWRACSVEEVVVTRDGRWAIAPDDNWRESDLEFLDEDTTTLVRIYRRHGRRRRWPDSAMRSANLICEELLLATQSIMGALRTRIPAGILPIPDDLELADTESGADDDDTQTDDGKDAVLALIERHLMTPIRDQRSAASLVPYLMRVPGEYLDKIKLVDLAREIDPKLIERMEHLIRRFSIATDMPPEQMTGKGDLNHWNIYELDADGIRMHAEPVTMLITGAMTSKLWRPRLELAGVADPERWVISYDPSEAMAHPDLSENAMEGYNASPPLVNAITAAKAIGFSEDEMPTPEEVTAIMEYRRTTAKAGQQFGDQEQPAPGEPPAKDNQPADGTQASGAPSRRQLTLGEQWGRIEATLTRDLLVDADGALRRMVERASARVASAASKRGQNGAPEDVRQMAAAVPVDRLAAALGPERVAALGLDDDDLWAGGMGALLAHWNSWTAKARADALAKLERRGATIDPDDLGDWTRTAEQNTDEGWHVLETGLAAVAAGLLFAPSTPARDIQGESDPSISVPPRVVRDALGAAGGGPTAGMSGKSAGLLAGKDFEDFLGSVVDFEQEGYLWTVGAPQHPFEPHQELDGVEFASWTDDNLEAPPDEFPFVSFYAPQDHGGCQCIAVPSGYVSQAEGILASGWDENEHPRGADGKFGDSSDAVQGSIIDRVREQGGLTVNPLTGAEPTDGFIVARQEGSEIVAAAGFFDDREAGIDMIDQYLADHAADFDGDAMLGLWHDTAHGEVVFDVVDRIASRDDAIAAGQSRDQQAIWDVAAGAEIDTGGSGGRPEE